jgi:uncharacterized protein (DUF849 family)
MTISPVSITVAPNGARKTKADHPAIPLSPADLAETAMRCLDAGASMIHAHVRNADGSHLIDVDAYKAATAAIRAVVGDRLVVQITTEAVGKYTPAEQRAVVRGVKPEAVSMAFRELVPDASEEGTFSDLLGWMKEEAVAPQIILYDAADAVRLADFRKRGLVPFDRLSVLYVLGRYTLGQTSRPADLLTFLGGDAPVFDHWSVCAFGAQEVACVTTGALLGGHIRVGFENNELLPNGERAENNEALVAAAREAVNAVGLKVATADDLRAEWQG